MAKRTKKQNTETALAIVDVIETEAQTAIIAQTEASTDLVIIDETITEAVTEASPEAVTEVEAVNDPVMVPTTERSKKWIIRVTGSGLGRGRCITPRMNLDPWYFHALQWNTKVEAEKWLERKGTDWLNAGHYAAPIQVEKAWYEDIGV